MRRKYLIIIVLIVVCGVIFLGQQLGKLGKQENTKTAVGITTTLKSIKRISKYEVELVLARIIHGSAANEFLR